MSSGFCRDDKAVKQNPRTEEAADRRSSQPQLAAKVLIASDHATQSLAGTGRAKSSIVIENDLFSRTSASGSELHESRSSNASVAARKPKSGAASSSERSKRSASVVGHRKIASKAADIRCNGVEAAPKQEAPGSSAVTRILRNRENAERSRQRRRDQNEYMKARIQLLESQVEILTEVEAKLQQRLQDNGADVA